MSAPIDQLQGKLIQDPESEPKDVEALLYGLLQALLDESKGEKRE
jgi:hypothetical protein